jgi:hypothetical protein
MFVLYHTGPTIGDMKDMSSYEISRITIQRNFVLDLLVSRLAVATLNQIEYIDSKVIILALEFNFG